MKKITFDIIYTWIDFTNKHWKIDYNYYFSKRNGTFNIINRSNSNLEELKYSLRSIEKYLKFQLVKFILLQITVQNLIF